jgi:glycosyltransferase involved in cell wall biosynthesis
MDTGYSMAQQKKVLIITYYFPPSGGAGVQRWLKMIKYLPQFGIDPVVLTVSEEYASYPQYDASLLADVSPQTKVYRTKSTEVLSLYKKLSPKGEIPHTGFSNEPNPNFMQKVARFIRGNLFLPDARKGWNVHAYKKAVELIAQEGIDTIITTSPPHSTQLVGLKLKQKFPNLTWVADLRDPWSDIFYQNKLYQTAFAQWLNKRYEKQVLAHADKVLTVSDDCRRLFEAKITPKYPIVVLPNGYDPDDFTNVPMQKQTHKFVLSYVGVFSEQYRIDVLIDALTHLAPKWADKVMLQFVGVVYQEGKKKLQALPYQVEFVDYVLHKQAVAYMCNADALLLCIPDIAHNKGILTGKLFEYLAARKPIVLVGPKDGDAATILERCEAGLCCDYQADQLINMLLSLLSGEFSVSQQPYQVAYSRREITRQLAHLLLNL